VASLVKNQLVLTRAGPGREARTLLDESDNFCTFLILYVSANFAQSGAMSEMTLTGARARLSEVADHARVAHDPVFLTRRGRRVAAVVDADMLEQLIEAAEDLTDLKAAAAALAEMCETDQTPIPWEQVKADLDLT
jgi:prevent-host-death family protein